MEALIFFVGYLLYAFWANETIKFVGPKMVNALILAGKEEQLRRFILSWTPMVF